MKSRYLVLGQVAEALGGRDIKSLTLPADNFAFENLLIREFKSRVNLVCVERDINTFGRGRVNCPSGVHYYHTDVFRYILLCKDKYNLIWLDLCSCLSNELVYELQNVVDSDNIADECLFCVTIQRARETDIETSVKGSKCRSLEGYRKKGFPRDIAKAALSVGRTCELLDIYDYQSSNRRSAPMSVYMFLIKQNTNND